MFRFCYTADDYAEAQAVYPGAPIWRRIRWLARWDFRRQRALQGWFAAEATEESISMTGPDGRFAKTDWEHFLAYMETQNLFLLFGKAPGFLLLPKRAFPPEQLAEFRGLLNRKLPQK